MYETSPVYEVVDCTASSCYGATVENGIFVEATDEL